MSNVLILGTRHGGKTARKLAKIMDADYGDNYVDTRKRYKLVFRYGNSYAPIPERRDATLNYAYHITRNANKPFARELMLQAGVSCPKLYYQDTIKGATFPVVARPRHHFKGKEFNICHSLKEAMDFINIGYYIQEFIDNGEEYRIYILNGKVFECAQKIARPTLNFNDQIRNFDNGWTFRWKSNRNVDEELKSQCIRASHAVQLSFCAIDCCITRDGRRVVFEANTAPSLNDRKLKKLADQLTELFNL